MSDQPEREQGFALPFTIFLIAFLTVLLAAAALRVAGDRRIAEALGRNSNAFAVAQSGLQYYMGTRTIRPEFDTAKWTATHDGDSMRVNVNGGYAIVVTRIVQRPADTSANETYLVKSTGYHVIPLLGAEPQAARTMAQFAVWQTASIDVHAALVLVNGTANNLAVTGTIAGADSTGCSSPLTTTAGLRVPSISNPSTTGISGSPAVVRTGTMAQVFTETDIDWARTVGSMVPDHSYNSTDCANGNFVYDTLYTVHMCQSNAKIAPNFQGTGLFIVTGDLNFGSAVSTPTRGWRGLILVGGVLTWNTGGNPQLMYGQVIAGLNQGATKTDLSNGTGIDIKYNSCYVRKSLTRMAGMRAVANAWVDNWASY